MPDDRFDTPAGRTLREHSGTVGQQPLRDLLRDPERPRLLTFDVGPLTVDLSRMRGDVDTARALCDLAGQLGVVEQLTATGSGHVVNITEGRAALHTALRARADAVIEVDGMNVMPDVTDTAERVSDYVEAVLTGAHAGATGERITDVVIIGIGGSDLGPRMVTAATRAYHTGAVSVHFVANVDPAELDTVLAALDARRTLVVVISKTFTTVETLANARAAREWLVAGVGEDVTAHLCAVTTAVSLAAEFGVSSDAVFGFRDWVGGRFSLSSAVGIGIEFAVGRTGMASLREGMRAIDERVLSDRPYENAALMLGMLDVWYSEFLGTTTKAVVPYSQDLALLPAHLQQLQMESNGKSVTASGQPVSWPTSPIVWGAPGTNGQHAFFQLLHQGTHLVPVDFIGVKAIRGDERADLLQANLLAQAAALALGRTREELAGGGVPEELLSHKAMPGNRPSTVIWMPDLSPHSVGALIALYEHATVVAGFAWGIDPFDQWGVERGKELANALLPAVAGGQLPQDTDAATTASLRTLLG
ncbi:MAG TPA: glucose-6-phosphate isomerase [Actinomycetes bacterium]|nr:glucose-6-phosphate isomerase [Actinomycetes bacterium]